MNRQLSLRLAVGMILFSVFAVAGCSAFDSTMYECGTGRALGSEVQEILEDDPGYVLAWYRGNWTKQEVAERCARQNAQMWLRVLSCTLIRELDGSDDFDVLARAKEADLEREANDLGNLPIAWTMWVELDPPPRYHLRADPWGDGDWRDSSAADIVISWDHADNITKLGDLCFATTGFSEGEP